MKRGLLLHKLAARLWYGGSPWAWLLLPFAAVYWLIATLRRLFYSSGLLSRPELPVPVIVVGNISAGGTGKTPVVAWLAGRLQAAGLRPAIVSRGYGGTHSGAPLLLADATPVEASGDEPRLLRKLTGCDVVVSADRAAAVQCAAGQGADLVIADDGLQHYRMRRAVELAVVDGQRGLGNGWLLPAGPLRETRARLATVDAVLSNGACEQPEELPGCITFELQQGHAVALDDGREKSLDEFSGTVWGVAGIGNPQRFYESLRARGLEVLETDVPDHGRIDIAALLRERDVPVLMTEKDAIKYGLDAPAGAWYVPVSLAMAEDEADRLIAMITTRLAQQSR